MATCVDIGKAEYPRVFEDSKIHPMEGVSLSPAFSGKSVGRKTPIFWEHEGNRAVREGKWKLVAKGRNSKWELYDIEVDRAGSGWVVERLARTRDRAGSFLAIGRATDPAGVVPDFRLSPPTRDRSRLCWLAGSNRRN